MDEELTKKFAQIQLKLLNAIKSHQVCFEKIQNGDQSNKIKDELLRLKKQMLQCNEEQKILLHELNNQVVSDTFTFNLYKIPPGAVPKKHRRRKDQLPGKIERRVKNTKEMVRTRSPALSSSSSNSSSSASSSDSEEEREKAKLKTTRTNKQKQFDLKQRPRPTLLPKKPQEAIKSAVPERQPQNIVSLTIERYYKKTHMSKSPKKGDSKDNSSPQKIVEWSNAIEQMQDDPELPKITFLATMNLIPKEIAPEIMEIINRKTERKRRSTANNQFVYNNDWEMPLIATRPKQYLSPTKTKTSTDDEKPSELVGTERMERCNGCETEAIAVECTKCMKLYHPNCPKVEEELMQSFLKCPKCFKQSSTVRDLELDRIWNRREKSQAYSTKEIEEQAKVRDHLKKLIRFRELEKTTLEKAVLKHTENIVLQKKVVEMQIQDGVELEKKINKIRNFILLYQKTAEIKPNPDTPEDVSKPAENPQTNSMDIENPPTDDMAEMDTQPVSQPESITTENSTETDIPDSLELPSSQEIEKEDENTKTEMICT